MRKKTLDELIEKANIIHNSKYTYENFCLINTKFSFKDTIERDRRKRNKCIENDVKLYYFTFEKQYIKDFNEYVIYTDYNEMINDITDNRKPTLS